MEKICCICKKLKDVSKFGKLSAAKDGLRYQCKSCRRNLYLSNKDDICIKRKKFYRYNKDSKLKVMKCYYQSNRDKICVNKKDYYLKNKNKINIYKKHYRYSLSIYSSYFDKLTIDESPILSSDDISLEVKCKYCGKYFIPNNSDVQGRISALNGNATGDHFLYCSKGCKDSCPIYRQRKYPRGFKKATAREVDPILRQMCFERDNWECQICGKSVEEVILHCHHIEGYTQNPLLGNDIDNVITLCKGHHKEIHKLPGCGYYELKCVEESV